MNQPKPKRIVFSIHRSREPVRFFIWGRLYVGYVGIMFNIPKLISFDLWILKWQKGYGPNA